jgi:hypothetical protein
VSHAGFCFVLFVCLFGFFFLVGLNSGFHAAKQVFYDLSHTSSQNAGPQSSFCSDIKDGIDHIKIKQNHVTKYSNNNICQRRYVRCNKLNTKQIKIPHEINRRNWGN